MQISIGNYCANFVQFSFLFFLLKVLVWAPTLMASIVFISVITHFVE